MRRLLRALGPALAASLLLAGVAQAHAYVQAVDPPDAAVLSRPPSVVRVQYTEAVEPFLTRLVLRDGAGRIVDGTRQVALGNRVLALELPQLPAGNYSLETRTVAQDGHLTDETTAFSILAGATAASGAPAALPDPLAVPDLPPSQTRMGPWAYLGLGLAALLLAASTLYGLLTRPRYSR